ncbi:MAG: shikimate kinase [Candidatus Magnetominusculus sp. LBB02]|nr:shikimate kinase [Candidatus Magnetominusculus sp. LBB02]
MKNIVLTGFMGTGKTTIGRVLAKSLGRVLIDLDAEIEKKMGMKITDIFAEMGEAAFRDMETEMARTISTLSNAVISTGGGIVLRKENIELLRTNGIVVNLTAEPDVLYARLASATDRPLLNVADPLAKIRELLQFRRPFYQNADIVIDTGDKTPIIVAEEIIQSAKLMGR